MATDPFSWAQNFSNEQAQLAENARQRQHNVLLQAFQEQMLRDRPYATMPAEIALMNARAQAALPIKLAEEARALDAYKQRRIIANDLAIQKAQQMQKLGLSGGGNSSLAGYLLSQGVVMPPAAVVDPAEEE